MAHEGVSLMVIQRQLGHSNLDITSVYPQGIDGGEIMETIHVRRYLLQRLTTALIDGAAEALLVARSDTLPGQAAVPVAGHAAPAEVPAAQLDRDVVARVGSLLRCSQRCGGAGC
jgi:hypothetical protein